MKPNNYWILGVIATTFLFLGIEFFNTLSPPPIKFWGTENFLAVYLPQKTLLTFGEDSERKTKIAEGLISTFLQKPKSIFFLNRFKVSETLEFSEFQIQKIGIGISKARIKNVDFFFFEEAFSGISPKIPVKLESDFWVLEKSSIDVTSFPVPKKGIILLNTHVGKNLENLALLQKIPLIKPSKNFFMTFENGIPKIWTEEI